MGRCLGDTTVQFEKAENSSLNLVGKSKGKVSRQSVFSPDCDFQKMGIGGMDNEFSVIFRRAFASRVFPPEVVEQLGCKHVKGILLYGPPGMGKTLMAHQIGTMLNACEPKIVNGPQVLGKNVGESEANIRRLFADAEEEEKLVFDDAYRSQLSCILVEDTERLLDYYQIGPRYCSLTLQALLVLLKKQPPKGRKLLILCTSSRSVPEAGFASIIRHRGANDPTQFGLLKTEQVSVIMYLN
ncbi:vesicle-fusing ATPase 1-like [Cryptotermes secundus]|uniref:vesicle-fusing ATPase 1-like n=1 Tax=Cryptotermes secundus TaxID=105785 RepID=UPI001454DCFB|nr:vesicle-fusing ATPase 1-like [Cryptotermes secundus]